MVIIKVKANEDESFARVKVTSFYLVLIRRIFPNIGRVVLGVEKHVSTSRARIFGAF